MGKDCFMKSEQHTIPDNYKTRLNTQWHTTQWHTASVTTLAKLSFISRGCHRGTTHFRLRSHIEYILQSNTHSDTHSQMHNTQTQSSTQSRLTTHSRHLHSHIHHH